MTAQLTSCCLSGLTYAETGPFIYMTDGLNWKNWPPPPKKQFIIQLHYSRVGALHGNHTIDGEAVNWLVLILQPLKGWMAELDWKREIKGKKRWRTALEAHLSAAAREWEREVRRWRRVDRDQADGRSCQRAMGTHANGPHKAEANFLSKQLGWVGQQRCDPGGLLVFLLFWYCSSQVGQGYQHGWTLNGRGEKTSAGWLGVCRVHV